MSPRRVLVVVVFLVVWGLITHGTYAGSGDEPHYLIIAQSIAFDGDLDVANNYAQPGNLIGAGGLQPEAHARPGPDGVLRPVHDIGLPLLFAPYVRVVYPLADVVARSLPTWVLEKTRLNASLIFRHFISLAMAVLTGLIGTQLFSLFLRVATTERQAMGWALLLTLSPPLLSHSFLFFTEIPSALLVAWIFKVLSEPAPDDGLRGPALVGSAIGLLLLIHVRNIALVAVFSAWAIARLYRAQASRASWGAFGVGVAALLLVRTVVVYRFWGTLLTTPIARPDLSMSGLDAAREIGSRTVGLLVSRDFGLLPFAPVFLLAIPGLWLIRTKSTCAPHAVWALVGAYLTTLVLPYTNPWGVSGGFAPAARMIVPIMPLLALALFVTAQTIPKTGRVLIGIQLLINVYVWQFPKVMWSGQ
ncbi:MAG TPA: hypothetical protein VKB50_24295 [Vicinamibacterales bacterium]|nr:hypothetical protein [Vicinamibacterales bacterium]